MRAAERGGAVGQLLQLGEAEGTAVEHGDQRKQIAQRLRQLIRVQVAARSRFAHVRIERREVGIGLAVVQVLHAAAVHLAQDVAWPAVAGDTSARRLERLLVRAPCAHVQIALIGVVELQRQALVRHALGGDDRAVLGVPAQAAPGAVQLLGDHHRLAVAELLRVLLEVLDVELERGAVGGAHLALHRDGDRRLVLDQLQQLGDVVARGYLPPADHPVADRIDQPLRQRPAQLHRLDAVFLAAGQLAFEAQLGDQPVGADRGFRDVGGQVAVDEAALADDTAESADRRQLQAVGVGVLLDTQRIDS